LTIIHINANIRKIIEGWLRIFSSRKEPGMHQEPIFDLVKANQNKIKDFYFRESALFANEVNQKNARSMYLRRFIQLIRPTGRRIGLINLIDQEY